MTINEKIKLIRTTKAITQAKFAKLIGINHDSRVREIEFGKYKAVGSAKLEKICNLFTEYALWLMTNKTNLKKSTTKKTTLKIINSRFISYQSMLGWTTQDTLQTTFSLPDPIPNN